MSFLIKENKFEQVSLPIQAQYAPVYGITVIDFDDDGNKDILMGGNLYGVKPEFGRYDATYGIALKGDGQGNFDYVTPIESGIRLDGEIRDIHLIKKQDNELLIATRNNDSLLLFERK